MLPPFIIEQIRKREEQERVSRDQPQLDLPLERPRPPRPAAPSEEEPERGVIILDI